jgi:hypothetical protein
VRRHPGRPLLFTPAFGDIGCVRASSFEGVKTCTVADTLTVEDSPPEEPPCLLIMSHSRGFSVPP